MKLFGGPIAWRANKQDTVTTSSTEAELLALSQTAKEAIFVSRLFKAITLQLNEPLIIDSSTRQYLPTLVASRIRNKTSAISMESDEGDDRQWTYEGPAQAGGYQGAAE